MATINIIEAFCAVPYRKRDHGAFRALRDIEEAGERVIHLDLKAQISVDKLNPNWEWGCPTANVLAITDRRLVAFGSDGLPSGLPGVSEKRGHIVLEIAKGDISSIKAVPSAPHLDWKDIHVIERNRTHVFEWFLDGKERDVMTLLYGLF
ncbi:hypothetical protein [Sphingobium sp. Z007]|uniref:hypothetical protein n=1 Tax=Sphingobium sp. Z007 TaxID=627495 RepID=UPI000B4991B4|nr:hypothetical protein [Sphingobium sp. Z007]